MTNLPTQTFNKSGDKRQLKAVVATSIINELFNSLMGIYPAWRSAFPNDEVLKLAKANWLLAFRENNVNTSKQISLGLVIARKVDSPFMPSSGQFISWIKQEEYRLAGISSCKKILDLYLTSRQRSLEKLDCSDYEYWILLGLYKNNAKALSSDKLDKLIKNIRDEAIELFNSGEGVPARTVVIEDKSKEPFVIPLTPPSEEEWQVTEEGLQVLKRAMGRA